MPPTLGKGAPQCRNGNSHKALPLYLNTHDDDIRSGRRKAEYSLHAVSCSYDTGVRPPPPPSPKHPMLELQVFLFFRRIPENQNQKRFFFREKTNRNKLTSTATVHQMSNPMAWVLDENGARFGARFAMIFG